jgi:hypothetical protein
MLSDILQCRNIELSLQVINDIFRRLQSKVSLWNFQYAKGLRENCSRIKNSCACLLRDLNCSGCKVNIPTRTGTNTPLRAPPKHTDIVAPQAPLQAQFAHTGRATDSCFSPFSYIEIVYLAGANKIVSVEAIKAYRGSRYIAPVILNLGSRWDVVNFMPWPRYPPGERTAKRIEKTLYGPQTRSGRFGGKKNLSQRARIRTPDHQSRCPAPTLTELSRAPICILNANCYR